jgi:carbon storage regulator
MLALARKVNESIMIGNDVEITLLEIKGDQVKIGISAPRSVPVYRKEIYLQIQEENRNAMQEVDISLVKEIFSEKSK